MENYSVDLAKAHNVEGLNLDLTIDLNPPKKMFIEIKVLKNCSYDTTELGKIKLEKGTKHILSRSVADHLIKQGLA